MSITRAAFSTCQRQKLSPSSWRLSVFARVRRFRPNAHPFFLPTSARHPGETPLKIIVHPAASLRETEPVLHAQPGGNRRSPPYVAKDFSQRLHYPPLLYIALFGHAPRRPSCLLLLKLLVRHRHRGRFLRFVSSLVTDLDCDPVNAARTVATALGAQQQAQIDRYLPIRRCIAIAGAIHCLVVGDTHDLAAHNAAIVGRLQGPISGVLSSSTAY